MKKLLEVYRITNAMELLTTVGNMAAAGVRAGEILSDEIYRIGVYEETLSDGSKTLNFWIRPETKAETRRENA